MKNGIRHRLLTLLMGLLAATILSFWILHLSPADPVTLHMQQMGIPPSPEAVAELRSKYGLDEPVPVQYGIWLKGVLHGDLGYSIVFGTPCFGSACRGDSAYGAAFGRIARDICAYYASARTTCLFLSKPMGGCTHTIFHFRRDRNSDFLAFSASDPHFCRETCMDSRRRDRRARPYPADSGTFPLDVGALYSSAADGAAGGIPEGIYCRSACTRAWKMENPVLLSYTERASRDRIHDGDDHGQPSRWIRCHRVGLRMAGNGSTHGGCRDTA